MSVKKTRKENKLLKPRKKQKTMEKTTELRGIPSIVPGKWHPVDRKEKSLNSKYAEAVGADLHSHEYEVSEAELEQMRRIAFS